MGIAVPHNEVMTADFYKHVESEGLPEPRRMRQLLTWCATRAMGDKPTGTEFEDQSVRMAGEVLRDGHFKPLKLILSFAARVIQEELLKDLANRSEMSDWFSREDAPKTAAPLVTRPHPKNIQNVAKIQELEQQIHRYGKKRNQFVDVMTDMSCVLGCKKIDTPLKHYSDHYQYPPSLNTPARKCGLLHPKHLSSRCPPMPRYPIL